MAKIKVDEANVTTTLNDVQVDTTIPNADIITKQSITAEIEPDNYVIASNGYSAGVPGWVSSKVSEVIQDSIGNGDTLAEALDKIKTDLMDQIQLGVNQALSEVENAYVSNSTLTTTLASELDASRASILDSVQTYADDTQAVASEVNALKASFGNDISADAINAFIGNIALTKATSQEAFAQTVNTLTANYNGLEPRITSTETVVAGQFTEWDGTSTPKVGMYKIEDGSYWNYVGGTLGENNDGWVRTDRGALNAVDALDLSTTTKITTLQNQIDKSITTWFYSYGTDVNGNVKAPTLSDLPAKDWVDIDNTNDNDDEKIKHLGDLVYDRDSGYAYRFAHEDIDDTPDAGVIWTWVRITDVDITKALAAASTAQDTADHKRNTFGGPTPPTAYNTNKGTYIDLGEGDLWIPSADYVGNGTSSYPQYKKGELYVYSTYTPEGSTVSTLQWQSNTRYTDDTAVDLLQTGLGNGTIPLKLDNAKIGSTPLTTYVSDEIDKQVVVYSGEDHTTQTGMKVNDIYIEKTVDNTGAVPVDVINTYKYNGSSWVQVGNNANITALADLADGKRTVFAGSTIPSNAVERDLWLPEKGTGIRYIRDYTNGSSSNSGDHWVEIEVIDSNGVNVALNKTVTSPYSNSHLERITDGNRDTNSYASVSSSTRCYIDIDLGAIYTDIVSINVTHYYSDDRTYHETQTKVSDTKDSWVSIFNSAIDGEYAETPEGRTYSISLVGELLRYDGNDWVLATKYTENLDNFINAVNPTLVSLQNQVDNKLEYWFQNSTQDPKTAWTTSELREAHDGDLWYQLDTKLSKYYISSSNSWGDIQDKDALNALSNAAKAQSTADGKLTRFYGTLSERDDETTMKQGDQWTDSDTQETYVYDSTNAWVPLNKRQGQLYNASLSNPPAGASINDVWVITDRWYAEPYDNSNKKALTSSSTYKDANGSKHKLKQAVKIYDGKNWILQDYDSKESKQISWVGVASKLLYAPDGGLTGWQFEDGSGSPSEFKINAQKFSISDGQGNGVNTPFTINAGTNGAPNTIHFNGNVSIYGMVDNGQNSVYPGVRLADSDNHPSGAHEGDTYYNTTDGIVYSYTSAGWVSTKGDKGDTGSRGPRGPKGIQGNTGPSGATTYFHVAYSDSSDGSVNFNQSSGKYIGTYVDTTSTDSTSYSDYNWVLVKGADGVDGTNGVPGVNGKDGKTSYLHIKYSNDNGSTFTSNSGETVGNYIGTYTDFTLSDSTDVNSYKWAQIKGEQGLRGPKGSSTYTWVKYAEDSNGTGMVNAWQSGKYYIGIAYNKNTATESTTASDYTWTRIEGANGVDGKSIWYKWTGTSLQTKVSATSPGSGWAQTESSAVNLKGDKGNDGINGANGTNGSRGSGWYHTTSSNAINAYPSGDSPVAGDIVITNSNDPAKAKAYTRNSSNDGWDAAAAFVHGDMVIDGSITGEKVRTGTITSTDGTSMIINLDAGSIYIA